MRTPPRHQNAAERKAVLAAYAATAGAGLDALTVDADPGRRGLRRGLALRRHDARAALTVYAPDRER